MLEATGSDEPVPVFGAMRKTQKRGYIFGFQNSYDSNFFRNADEIMSIVFGKFQRNSVYFRETS